MYALHVVLYQYQLGMDCMLCWIRIGYASIASVYGLHVVLDQNRVCIHCISRKFL